jgi:hypothetical protein
LFFDQDRKPLQFPNTFKKWAKLLKKVESKGKREKGKREKGKREKGKKFK